METKRLMDTSKLIKNLEVPKGKVDVILDTDAYNEIDDQYAIAYMLRSSERINVRAICAAPFLNEKSISPEDGMKKSYEEIKKIVELCGDAEKQMLTGKIFVGSTKYLPNETTSVDSEAADKIIEIADEPCYSADHPLYIVAIGAITNVASALIKRPDIAQKTVIVWLGGHAWHWPDTAEFNMYQDVAAARVVFGCGAPVVQLPCMGVVSEFRTTEPELRYWLCGKNSLCDYLAENTIAEVSSYANGIPWSRVIWDVTAVAWLLNDNDRFMSARLEKAPLPEYDNHYAFPQDSHFMLYVYSINRDGLMYDLIEKLTKD